MNGASPRGRILLVVGDPIGNRPEGISPAFIPIELETLHWLNAVIHPFRLGLLRGPASGLEISSLAPGPRGGERFAQFLFRKPLRLSHDQAFHICCEIRVRTNRKSRSGGQLPQAVRSSFAFGTENRPRAL